MILRRVIAPLLVVALFVGVHISNSNSGFASSLVGSTCSKLNMEMGDGPNKSVVCKLVGKKKLWQNLAKTASTTGNPSQGSSTSSSGASSNLCKKVPQFTANFIDPKYVRVVTPIGEQTGGGGVIAVRSYIHPDQTFSGQQLPIYATTDMTLYSANYYKLAGASDTYKPEYSLYFDAGCGITVKFFHIKGVVGKVASVVPTGPSSSSAGQGVKNVSVKAGEQIGWYLLGENSVAFDFWVDDASITNSFIVQSHYASSNALHSVCPYSFYTAEKKAIWLAKLGAPGSDPIPGTTCGTISEGVAGTAEGMWFISPNTLTDVLSFDGPYQSQIMFTTDASGTVRIGGLNASSGQMQMMVSSNAPTWKKPVDVRVGDSYCWSTARQSVKVHVISTKSMAVLVAGGSCEAIGDAESGRTYQR